VGTQHFTLLTAELRRLGVERIDTSVHMDNADARRFYERLGFRPLREERFAYLLQNHPVT
jgi:ribosomal protein S18 acetylase RimI-like enzyme